MVRNRQAGDSASDAVNAGASAIETAMQAARDGAADARAAVDRAIPAIAEFTSRLVYTTSYAISYGVVFPTLLVARAIPKDNVLVHGLVDGARAATDMVDDWRGDRQAALPGEAAAAAP
jgi:hypothetical protein